MWALTAIEWFKRCRRDIGRLDDGGPRGGRLQSLQAIHDRRLDDHQVGAEYFGQSGLGVRFFLQTSNTKAKGEIRQRSESARVKNKALNQSGNEHDTSSEPSGTVKSSNKDTAFTRMSVHYKLLCDLKKLGWDSWVNRGNKKSSIF